MLNGEGYFIIKTSCNKHELNVDRSSGDIWGFINSYWSTDAATHSRRSVANYDCVGHEMYLSQKVEGQSKMYTHVISYTRTSNDKDKVYGTLKEAEYSVDLGYMAARVEEIVAGDATIPCLGY